MDRRRTLVALAAFAGLSRPSVVRSQAGKSWRIGILSIRPRPISLENDRQYGPFIAGLRDLGYVEGKNLALEWRFAHGDYDLLPGLADELVNLKVDLLAVINAPVIRVAQRATKDIPIVMLTSSDPVGAGFVQSLAHPGGNITGVSNVNADLAAKYLELMKSMVPRLSSVVFLANPANVAHRDFARRLDAAAAQNHIRVLVMQANTPAGLDAGFASVAKKRPGGLIVGLDTRLGDLSRQIGALALKYRIPSITWNSHFAVEGALISFGTDIAENYRLAASYVDKIFKGAKPAELPVETPTTFRLVINRRTAKALGLTIPKELLLRADEVIE